ncbi:MAG: putative glycoside hydrolase, partial [Patescibacteria group bacterium]
MRLIKNKYLFAGMVITGFFLLSYFVIPPLFTLNYKIDGQDAMSEISSNGRLNTEFPKVAAHINTPLQVKAIYMTNWVAGEKLLRSALVKIADETEINSIVIDIKDYTGRIAFEVSDPLLKE